MNNPVEVSKKKMSRKLSRELLPYTSLSSYNLLHFSVYIFHETGLDRCVRESASLVESTFIFGKVSKSYTIAYNHARKSRADSRQI